jgi:electron transfer flavoprotein alpha subunit
MSIIVLAENAQGSFKKKTFEAVQYAAELAQKMSTTVTAVALGNIADAALQELGQYGATKVLHIADARLDNLNTRAYTKALATAAEKEDTRVIVCLHDVTGKAVAPRLSARIKAGMVAGAVSQPDMSNGFVVKKNVFSGKAFAFVNIATDVKIINLMPNTFSVKKGEGRASVE